MNCIQHLVANDSPAESCARGECKCWDVRSLVAGTASILREGEGSCLSRPFVVFSSLDVRLLFCVSGGFACWHVCALPPVQLVASAEPRRRGHVSWDFIDHCEPPSGHWELNQGLLDEQPVLSTAELFLKP